MTPVGFAGDEVLRCLVPEASSSDVRAHEVGFSYVEPELHVPI
jgi:hypothetical protein